MSAASAFASSLSVKPALVAYLSACGISLVYLTRATGLAGFLGSSGPDDLTTAAAAAAQMSSSSALMFSDSSSSGSELMVVLESLLQKPLGVFVFSNFVIACCAAVAAITTSVFLESLTPSEAGRLTQRLLKYLLFKVALVGMVVLPKEVQLLHWLPWLGAIGEMKMFLGLAKDRLAGLSVTPTVGLSRHVRTLCLLGFILGANVLGLTLLHRHTGALSWAISLLFALDLGIISVEASKAALSCVSLLMDEALAVHTPALLLPSATLSGRAVALWDSWQGKGRERFFYHTELLADVAVHLLTLLHHMHVWLLHGMSFHLLDALLLLDTRVVVMSFVQRVRAHLMHRAATHSLDHTFPNATDKTLLADDAECAICRDKLSAAKQLPCGHLFHLPCLRAWLQQSGHDNFKCPICRRALCVHRPQGAAAAAGSGDGADGTGGRAAAAAGAGWGGLAGAQRSPAGIMGTLSFSMSYNDLTARGHGGHVSLEEQLMLQQVGFADADEQQLARGATGANNNLGSLNNAAAMLAMGAMGGSGSDADGFDSLLAQAIAASLQTAHVPAAGAAPLLGEEAEELLRSGSFGQEEGRVSSAGDQLQQQPGAAAAEAAAAADGEGSSHATSGAVQQQQQQQQGSAATEHSSSSSKQQLRRRSCRTASLPVELLTFSCCKDTAAGQHSSAHPPQSDDVDRGDATHWSDPLSDSDAALNSCPDSHSVWDTCSRRLATLMSSSSSGSHHGPAASSSSAGASGKAAASGADAYPAAAGGSHASTAPARGRDQLMKGHRTSRSCSHLPDVLPTRHAGGLSAAATGCSQVAEGDSSSSRPGPVLESLLAQPREPSRRRQGGRWGRRRRIVVSGAGAAGGAEGA